MKNVELIYGPFRLEYKTRESALNAARRIAKKENGLSFDIRIKTGEKTARTESYTYNNDGKKC